MSGKTYWSDGKSLEQIEELADTEVFSVTYNLYEDTRVMREEIEELKGEIKTLKRERDAI